MCVKCDVVVEELERKKRRFCLSLTGVAKKGRSHPASGSVPEALTCCCLRTFARDLSRLSLAHEGTGKGCCGVPPFKQGACRDGDSVGFDAGREGSISKLCS